MINYLPDCSYSQEPLPSVDCLVLHAMSAINVAEAKDKYGMQESYNLLAYYGVSAHYLIGRNEGEAWQLVPYNLKAWHASKSQWRGREGVNHFSLGVELIGSEKLNNYTDWQYEELARWLVARSQEHNLTWDEITTHREISPGRKTDPWGLDLDRLKNQYEELMLTTPTKRGGLDEATHTEDGIPISDGFDFPVGSREEGASVWTTHKIDSILVDPQYKKAFNAWHTGEDWNGKGGGDTDLGDPIYSISTGKVVEFGYYTPSWGNIVLIEHALPNGSRVWSQYAHLDQIMVTEVGQIVERGQQIGTMGKGANNRWIAHLHFEIRKNKIPINAWKPYVNKRETILANYHDPAAFINEYRPHLLHNASNISTRLEVVVDAPKADNATGLFRKAKVDHWYTVPHGYQGTMLWTYAAASTETNWAEWRPNLPETGQWEVWAYVPDHNATTTKAHYKITHAAGTTEMFVNQSGYNNQWVRLGRYNFEEKQGYVRLSDLTGETTKGIMVGFDAIKWVKV